MILLGVHLATLCARQKQMTRPARVVWVTSARLRLRIIIHDWFSVLSSDFRICQAAVLPSSLCLLFFVLSSQNQQVSQLLSSINQEMTRTCRTTVLRHRLKPESFVVPIEFRWHREGSAVAISLFL